MLSSGLSVLRTLRGCIYLAYDAVCDRIFEAPKNRPPFPAYMSLPGVEQAGLVILVLRRMLGVGVDYRTKMPLSPR